MQQNEQAREQNRRKMSWPMKVIIAFGIAFALTITQGIATPAAETAFAADGADLSLTTSAVTTGKFNPKISKKTAKIAYGKSLKLKVTGTAGKTVKWTTSNKKVAKVSAKGKVTAVKAGKATITAKVGSKKLTCKVTVVGKLNATKVTMNAFQTKKLTLKGATAKSWKSNNKAVAVSSGGVLSLGDLIVADQTATITCTDTKGNKYKCQVTVTLPNITCEMDKTQYRTISGTDYYYKHFVLSNRSGKAVTVQCSVMHYYPYGLDSDSYIPLLPVTAANSVLNEEYLSDSPLTVSSGYWDEFRAFEGTTRHSITYDGRFALFITVDGADYYCGFTTSGELKACALSED